MDYPEQEIDETAVNTGTQETIEKGGPGSGRRPGSHNLKTPKGKGHGGFKPGHVVSPKARAAASAHLRAINSARRGQSRKV